LAFVWPFGARRHGSGAFGVGVDDSVLFLVRVLGAATLGLGMADRLALAPMWL